MHPSEEQYCSQSETCEPDAQSPHETLRQRRCLALDFAIRACHEHGLSVVLDAAAKFDAFLANGADRSAT